MSQSKEKIIKISKNAKIYLDNYMAKNPGSIGMYIDLEKAGCAGYMYKTKLVTEEPKDCIICQDEEISFFIPKDSLPRVNGSTLDYVKENLETKAVFNNPNVVTACGCGDSVELISDKQNRD